MPGDFDKQKLFMSTKAYVDQCENNVSHQFYFCLLLENNGNHE